MKIGLMIGARIVCMQSLSRIKNIVVVSSKNQVTVHPQTGKKEYIFVDLAAVYPTPDESGSELSFEEIMAANRGWLDRSWEDETVDESILPGEARHGTPPFKDTNEPDENLIVFDENGDVRDQPPSDGRHAKKKKVMEVNETQISTSTVYATILSQHTNPSPVKAKLDSPSGPKLRKKQTSEPTMTMHTKAATDDIYDIFNAPLNPMGGTEEDSAEEDAYGTDGDYTTDAESTGTNRHVDAPSERGDDETTDVRSLSEWSDLSNRRNVTDVEAPGTDAEVDSGAVPDVASDFMEPEPAGGVTEEAFLMPNRSSGGAVSAEHDSPPRTRTVFVPIPPEDYDPPTRPYRDAAEVANNRLPFMTPITERTEYSLQVDVETHDSFKTPCRRDGAATPTAQSSDYEPLSSPIREIVDEDYPAPKVPSALMPKTAQNGAKAAAVVKSIPPKVPVILENQCNPVDDGIRQDILSSLHPPLQHYPGFYDHRPQTYGDGAEIRKCAKATGRLSKGGNDKSPSPASIILRFPSTKSQYTLRRELGAGAFAPVYLVENSAPGSEECDETAGTAMGKGTFAVSHRNELEALKMETPPTPWEFYIMRLAHSRLGPQHRVAASLSYAHELHLYGDEAFLFLPYHPCGTLLDVVNFFHVEPSGVMDESLAMFFTIELMRTVEALHAKSILHGDLKADNCLLRLDALLADRVLAAQWKSDGTGGWASRGVVLIDFGRGIDMKAFTPDVQFIADWKTSTEDCAEMREGRPWTWQIDYHGLAGIIHCMLFGRFIETTRYDQGGIGTGRRYRIRESLKRYWQTELWSDCFEVLLNPGSFVDAEDGHKMPVLKSMRSVRERMEQWLEANCERGAGLRSQIGKLESYARSRKC